MRLAARYEEASLLPKKCVIEGPPSVDSERGSSVGTAGSFRSISLQVAVRTHGSSTHDLSVCEVRFQPGSRTRLGATMVHASAAAAPAMAVTPQRGGGEASPARSKLVEGWGVLQARTDAARAARRARSAGPAETELHGLLSHGSC